MTEEKNVKTEETKLDVSPDNAAEKKSTTKSAASKSTSSTKKSASTNKSAAASKSASASKSTASSTAKKTTAAKSTANKTSSNRSTAASKSASASRSTASSTAKKTTAAQSTANKTSSNRSTAASKSASASKSAASSSAKKSVIENTAKEESVEERTEAAAAVQETVEAVTDVKATAANAAAEQVPEVKDETAAVESDTDRKSEESASDTAEHDDKDYILEVEGLKTYFPIAKTIFGKPTVYLRAVDNVGFKIERGTTLGVVGESGCGKTTLGRTILKLYDPNGGKIVFNGDDLTHLKRSEMLKYRTKMQLIFQDPYSSLPPRMTVGSIIAEAVKIHKIVPKEQVYDYVQGVMKNCGLQPQYYDRYPHEFSGGQRQRICIARALAVKPELVVCDEPVSALDVSIQAQIINLLKSLQKQMGFTYLFISHDLSVVKYITDRILVMYLGNMMELGDTEEIFEHPLHPYTQALFSAVPAPDPDVKMSRIILEGDIPSPANPPKGCKFHTRCSKCMDVCKFKPPEYVRVKTESGKDHFVACHLYNEEVMNSLPAYTEEYNKLVEEQKAKEEQDRIKKENSVWYKFKKKFVGVFKKKKKDDGKVTEEFETGGDHADDSPDGNESVAPNDPPQET